MKRVIYLIFTLLLISCKTEVKKVVFEHDVVGDTTPWTSNIFEETEKDFTFAIIADLTGGERKGVYSTAVAQLNRLDPTFVLSVGDLIEGGTEDEEILSKEWDSFKVRTDSLNMPFFYLGGNHDLTNPVMRKFWKDRFGPRYYHFLYDNVLFLMLDSEDYEEKRMLEIYHARAEAIAIINGEIPGKYEDSEYYSMMERSVGAISSKQLSYFSKVLEENKHVKWTFVLMHKPLWLRADENGLSRLESLLGNRKFTVINGHFHSFSHRIRNNRDYIMLGTTGGSQKKDDPHAFDHISLVRMAEEPVITHVKMDGILDETGKMPISKN